MSNLDTLAAIDFGRNPFLETVDRYIHGDRTNSEEVEAVVEIDSGSSGGNTADGGLNERSDKLQMERTGRLEIAADQEWYHDDHWVINSVAWKAVGAPIGEDAGSKTLVIKKVGRITGRNPNVNTQV